MGDPGRAELALQAPLDVPESLESYRRWGDDLLDRWDGARLLRVLPMPGGERAAVRATSIGSVHAPRLLVQVEPAALLAPASDALRATFVVAPAAFARLRTSDPVVAALDARHPGLRPVLQPDLLTALVRSISAQQVNLTWAAETRRRLAVAFGAVHHVGGEPVHRLVAERLASATVAEIRALQFTTRKAESIVAVADELASGRLDESALATLDDEAVIARLVALRGIGRWSAEWILARTFGRPRVVAGDLGVRKAVARAYLGRQIADEDEVRAAAAHWGPAGTVAQALLLRSLIDEDEDEAEAEARRHPRTAAGPAATSGSGPRSAPRPRTPRPTPGSR